MVKKDMQGAGFEPRSSDSSTLRVEFIATRLLNKKKSTIIRDMFKEKLINSLGNLNEIL
jgi:hypothetical protein